jgi:tetratricopeptide (TPR) repeat protein
MHPDLLNNSLFLRYYNQWQKNPDSIVFASIADYLLTYGLIDDAHKVCEEGLKRHPQFTVGRFVMAKIHLKRGNYEEAEEQLRGVLQMNPKNEQAHKLLSKIDEMRSGQSQEIHMEIPAQGASPGETSSAAMPSEWQTITMANIYSAQGHPEKAREIYQSILDRDPQNETALAGLASIDS